MCRHKMSIMFNEICINEEMLPKYTYIYIYIFANGPEDRGSIPGRVIRKSVKMVLDTSLLNTQQYKVCIKGKVGQSRERNGALPYTSVL